MTGLTRPATRSLSDVTGGMSTATTRCEYQSLYTTVAVSDDWLMDRTEDGVIKKRDGINKDGLWNQHRQVSTSTPD